MADQANDVEVPWRAPPAPGNQPPSATAIEPARPASPLAPVSASREAVPALIPFDLRPTQTSWAPKQKTDRAARPVDKPTAASDLIVGRGISLSGEINSCHRLVVEGIVHANLQHCSHMTIAEGGLFDGTAAIDDVEVSGSFEGDLIVHNRLKIRGTGRVSGTITYGQLEIEAGGLISGALQPRPRNSPPP
jgi:cytoskeletal protein CcmA (bactofilin family)